jgi:PAS domain S-box-containing protein
MRRIFRIILKCLFIPAFLIAFSICAYTQPTPKKILLFSSEDVRLPASVTLDEAIRSTFNKDSSIDVSFYNESLDNARIPNEKYEVEYLNFLRKKYEGETIDLISVRGAGALRFLRKHEGEIFVGVPRIFSVTDRRQIGDIDLGPNVTAVYGRIEFTGTLRVILAQWPDTKRIVVITGNSTQDKSYQEQARGEFAGYAGQVEFAFLSGLSIEDLQTQLSTLPPDNVCIFISYFRGPDGRVYTMPGAISQVAPSVKVPMYAIAETAMGSGVVGGDMLSFQSTGERIAEVGKRILAGEKPSNIPETTMMSVPMFDWRQLRRWNISEQSLPAGSIVRYKEPTAWEQYQTYILVALAVLIIQSVLILALLLSRAKRRKAEVDRNRFQSLAEAEHARLDEVVSNVPGIVWESRVVDEIGHRRAQFISGYVEEMLGYTVEECLADPQFISSKVIDEDRDMYKTQAEQAFSSGGAGIVQFRCMTKEGGWKWAESHIVAIKDELGKSIGLRGVTMDITERKKAEEGLTLKEEQLTEAQRLAQVGNWEWNGSTGEVTWSEEIYRIYGLDPSTPALSFEEHDRLCSPESWERLQAAVAATLDTGEPYELEMELIRPDGSQIWASARGENIRVDGHLKLRGTLQDITARKIAEESVRQSETRFRNMADTAPVLIWMSDVAPVITFVNKSCLDFTGLTEDQLVGTGWLDVVHADDREYTIGVYNKGYEKKEPWTQEYRLRGADGSYHWFYATSVPRFASDGAFLGYIGSCVDIHDRKSAEEGLQRALEQIYDLKNQLQEENIYLKEVIKLEHNFDEIIGSSDALKYVLFKIEQVAPTDATVLITGETGTGKELVARAIHNTSLRKNRPLVKVNCAALSASLIESELFGHERGAFTGAAVRKIGRFELADGATIFLDEVGELPMQLQAKLLRVIQEGEFERLGSSKTIKVDVRIMAATNRNLEAEVRAGRFREDLLFRLNVFPVTVPPLRDRKEDIPILVEHFASLFSKKLGKAITTLSPTMMRSFTQYSWPGNIRELANVIERAVISSTGENLQLAAPISPTNGTDDAFLPESLETIERNHIMRVLLTTNWRIEGPNGAARILGLNPSTLRTRIAKLGIMKNDSVAM